MNIGAAIVFVSLSAACVVFGAGCVAAADETPAEVTAESAMQVKGNILDIGMSLYREQALIDPNRDYRAIFQGDGNFVVYTGNKALWASGTWGQGADRLTLQTDGNLVVYAGDRALWASGTQGQETTGLEMQNDGNLVLYARGHRAIWASGTQGGGRR